MASTTYKPRSSRPMPAQGLSAAEQIEPSFESPIITLISGNDDNVKLQIRYGEITGIFGNAGCGKSLVSCYYFIFFVIARVKSTRSAIFFKKKKKKSHTL